MADFLIAYIISPHGFGHAARASAVMEAIRRINSSVSFEVVSFVPEWFFQESLPGGVNYFPFDNDVGVVQVTPFLEDLPATVERLKSLVPFRGERIQYLAQHLTKAGSQAVICDIAPMGIAAAKQAGIPSVLIENFTWDWIYEGYLEQEPRLGQFLSSLAAAYDAADFHIQTQPICYKKTCDLSVSPTSRSPRTSRAQVREILGVLPESAMVLVTMGGIEQIYPALKRLVEYENVTFILPGSNSTFARQDNLILLPHHSQFFHPDLVHASDAVVGKLGYSTIAEAFHAGIPYGYVPRNQFRETTPLASFVKEQMGGIEIKGHRFESGDWVDQIEELLQQPRVTRNEKNGAEQIAEFLIRELKIPIQSQQD